MAYAANNDLLLDVRAVRDLSSSAHHSRVMTSYDLELPHITLGCGYRRKNSTVSQSNELADASSFNEGGRPDQKYNGQARVSRSLFQSFIQSELFLIETASSFVNFAVLSSCYVSNYWIRRAICNLPAYVLSN